MLNGFWSSRYLEGKLSNGRTCAVSPPPSCFFLPHLLSIAVSSCSQWFVSSGGSSCSFCIVISLIVIIRARYLQPWHHPPHEAIWAKREEAEENIQASLEQVLWFLCAVVWELWTYVLHSFTWMLCVAVFDYFSHSYTHLGLLSAKCNVFSPSGIHACKSNTATHICN